MGKKRMTRCLLTGVVAFSLVTTSLGGAFAATALAATPEQSKQESSDDRKTIIGGLVALGLIAALVKGGDDARDTANAGKNPAPVPKPAPNPTPAPVPNPAPTPAPSPAPAEQQALALLNADRTAYGLAPLRVNAKLTSLAQYYAQDMINRNFFSHNNPEGQTPFDRMKAWGIRFGYAGENLAINSSVAAAEKAFINSSGHRANILNPKYTQVGIGVRQNQKGQVYVVQEFTDG